METSEPAAPSPYDALLARHLHSAPEARLYVGDDLEQVNWAGIEASFGSLIVQVPGESILAVYDDSAFGRGTKGFVVTDHHLLLAQGKERELVALAQVEQARPVGRGVHVTRLRGTVRQQVVLKVDERPARVGVAAWLGAVADANAPALAEQQEALAMAGSTLTGREALLRLGRLVQSKRLGLAERQWLLRIAEQVREMEDTRLAKGKRRS